MGRTGLSSCFSVWQRFLGRLRAGPSPQEGLTGQRGSCRESGLLRAPWGPWLRRAPALHLTCWICPPRPVRGISCPGNRRDAASLAPGRERGLFCFLSCSSSTDLCRNLALGFPGFSLLVSVLLVSAVTFVISFLALWAALALVLSRPTEPSALR